MGAAALRRERDPRNGGAIPAHAQEHVQRHVRAVRELRLGAVAGRSGAGGPAAARPLGAVAARDGGAPTATRCSEEYDATAAARAIMEFVDDDVSNWYVRRSRSASTTSTRRDNRAAFATLHEVLVVACRLLAPFAPFVTDWMHRELTGESVHLAPYVRPEPCALASRRWSEAMARSARWRTLGRAAREAAGINVRQPLSRMVCVVPRRDAPRTLVRELLAAAGGGAQREARRVRDERPMRS